MFGGLGMGEMILIFLVVLLLFGAKRLPEIGSSLGKGIREFKSSVNEVKREVVPPAQPTYVPPPQPVNFLYSPNRFMPVKLRAFLDFTLPRLKARLAKIQMDVASRGRSKSS